MRTNLSPMQYFVFSNPLYTHTDLNHDLVSYEIIIYNSLPQVINYDQFFDAIRSLSLHCVSDYYDRQNFKTISSSDS